MWHDWWNASDRDARARVEITRGERFAHMIETLYRLARRRGYRATYPQLSRTVLPART